MSEEHPVSIQKLIATVCLYQDMDITTVCNYSLMSTTPCFCWGLDTRLVCSITHAVYIGKFVYPSTQDLDHSTSHPPDRVASSFLGAHTSDCSGTLPMIQDLFL